MKTASSDPNVSQEAVWRWALAALLLLTAAARGWILFSTPLMPGMNGAYYLVQARSVLTHCTLGIPDLPLTFYIQALGARLLHAILGGSFDASILLAVKLADSILPALIVLPVFLLVRDWTKAADAPTWIAFATSAVVSLNAAALSMVGDFEKNSLGLVWLASLLLFLYRWSGEPRLRNAVGVILFGGLAAVTHIAVFGAAVMFGGLTLFFYLLIRRRSGLHIMWPLLVGVGVVAILAAGVVLWKFDPHRIQKLASAIAHPTDYLSGSGMNAPWHSAVGGMPVRGPGDPRGGAGGPPGFRGRMGGPFRVFTFLPSLLFGISSLASLWVCWRKRANLRVQEICVVAACAVGVLILTGPWVQGDKSERFQLIAIGPAVLAGAFVLLHWKNRFWQALFCLAAVISFIGASVDHLGRGGHPVISEAAVAELRSLAPLIENPEKTLISARHGMEWWTAWTLHTHIAQSTALRTSDWSNFQAVFFLNAHNVTSPMMRGGPMPPPPGSGKGDMRPPGGGGPGEGGFMADPEIPKYAEKVYSGENLILARVGEAPEFVLQQSEK